MTTIIKLMDDNDIREEQIRLRVVSICELIVASTESEEMAYGRATATCENIRHTLNAHFNGNWPLFDLNPPSKELS